VGWVLNIHHPKMLIVVGKRHSGKSTVIEYITSELTRHGLKLGALKHSSHKHSIDREGSDSDRFRIAGAVPSAFSTPDGCAIYYGCDRSDDQNNFLNIHFKNCDILLVESFKNVQGPKIWICSDQDMDEIPDGTIAIIDDKKEHPDLPTFKFSDSKLVLFIKEYFELD
jgi:molybdopterin-guanine dinucleotide biosynthesis protein MobB